MNTVELFCGTKSFSKVAEKLGHKTFTVDIESKFNPDLCKDILELQIEDLPKKVDVLWCSPPCTTFSVASLRYYWDKGRPKNAKAWHGISIVQKTFQIIEELLKVNPDMVWFVENPRGMLRKQRFMLKYFRKTITYCQYGDTRQKPTDIWTNLNWLSLPPCKAGSDCHQSARRGARTGTQGIKKAKNRSEIPPALFEEIFEGIN